MNYNQLIEFIKTQSSYLCVGLDSDISKIPAHLQNEKYPLFEFNRQIIDATNEFCVAYKPNTAFYESLGTFGWENLQMTIEYLNEYFPNHFTIADAKRGDIGNTSAMYAKAFFETMNFDSVTVAPYMGSDSVQPFLNYKNKWVILLALTSNSGSEDFEELFIHRKSGGFNSESVSHKKLYEIVLEKSLTWASEQQMMYVTGATKATELKNIREIIPNHFLLVPGVGAQGGSLEEVSLHGMNKNCGLLVNSSRSIIYASNSTDFASKAGLEAKKVQEEMKIYLDRL
jgi:orotidine-5'-phosphate decarboxylase